MNTIHFSNGRNLYNYIDSLPDGLKYRVKCKLEDVNEKIKVVYEVKHESLYNFFRRLINEETT